MGAKITGALHFVSDWSGKTVCDKSAAHVRMTRFLETWDNQHIAKGRRCEECRGVVERIRTEATP